MRKEWPGATRAAKSRDGGSLVFALGPALAAGTAVLLWGAWFPITKAAVSTNLSEIELAFLRFVTAGAIALPILTRKGFRVGGDHGYLKAAALAFCAGAGYILIAALALRFAPSAYGMVTAVSMTMFNALLAMAFGAGKRNAFVWASITINVVGIACLVLLSSGRPSLGSDAALGVGLFVFAGLVFSLYNVFVAHWKVEPLHATALVSFYSALAVIPVYLAMRANSGALGPLPPPGEILFHMAYQGVLVSYVALALFTMAIHKLGSDRAAYLALAVPATAVTLSFLLLGERAEPPVLASIALLLAGMGLGIYGARRT
jgi:drug/metabolite transporter (DMT)-like permease